MGQIAAGQNFGQDVAQPRLVSESAIPRAAFGSTENLQRIGAQQEAEGLQQQRQAAAYQDQVAREQQHAREKADAAVAQSKVYLQRDQLNDAIQQIDAGIQDGTVPKDKALEVWRERSGAIISKSTEGVPGSHAEAVALDGRTITESLTSKIGQMVQRRDQRDTAAALNATLEYTQRLAVTDPAKARDITAETFKILGPAAGMTPEQIQKAHQGWTEQTAFTRAFTAVHGAKNDNRALAAVEAALNENQEIDPQRKAGLLAQIDGFRANNEARALRQAQHAEIVAARVQRESQHAFGILSAWALAGKAANPDANSALIGKLTPEDAAAYRALAAEIPSRTAAAMLPVQQQQAQIESLYAQRAASGTSQALEAEIKRREQVLAESKRDYASEPLRAGQERGILDQPLQPLNVSSIEALTQGLAVRIQQAESVATRAGRPVSPLMNDEASRLGSIILALPANQRAERISQLAQMIPPHQAQALAGQMMKGQGQEYAGQASAATDEKRALGIAFALGASRTTNGRATSELVLKGAEALKAKTIKEDKLPADGWRGQINKLLAEAFLSPEQAELAGEGARLVLAGLVAEGASGTKNDALRAVRLAVGGDIREVNGIRTVIPAGIEPTDISTAMRSAAPAQLQAQAPDGTVLVDGRPMAAADFLARLPEAKLRYIDGDANGARYVVQTPSGFAANKQRRPIIFTVKGSGR